MKCERCGKEKDDVKYVVNPYDLEINEELIKENLCEECYDDLNESI